MKFEFPQDTRVVDAIRIARAQGKRLVWRSHGFRYRAHLEDAANDQPCTVTRLRPRLRVVDSKHQ